MNTVREETSRVKSSGSSAGSSGGKNRRHSIGITASGKSSGEEVNNVPNYLTASTGPVMNSVSMNTLSEETPRVKSSGSSADSSGKKRRRSIDITSSEKSSGEEVNNVPNYLRASNFVYSNSNQPPTPQKWSPLKRLTN
ncbi:hypothetical protein Tco_0809688 [Tanacetum coccineum]